MKTYNWKLAIPLLTACGLALSPALACNSSGSAAPPIDAGQQDVTVADGPAAGVGQIAGAVKDFSGTAAGGVQVAAGSVTATTAADGTYTLTNVPAGAAVIVSYTKAAYLPTAHSVALTAGQSATQNAVIIPMVTPVPLDATKGGTVKGLRGSTLTADPAAFVDPSGNVVTGSVNIFLRPLDPASSQDRNAYPGTLVGVGTSGGTPSPLMPYGTLEVTVQQGSNTLQVASGKTLTIKIPATAAGGAAKSSSLWSFEPTTATWLQEGTATLSGGFYTATLHHLCYHTVSCEEMSGGDCSQCGGNAMCGDGCTDTSSDPNNCGSCGHVCPDLAICVVGMCSTLCGGGASMCDGDCVDSTSDPSNCGGCGMTCPDGQACSNGMCTDCDESAGTMCGGDCVDIGSDNYNCGMCDNECPSGAICAGGMCVDDMGFVDGGLDSSIVDSGGVVGLKDSGTTPPVDAGAPTVTLTGGIKGTFGCSVTAAWSQSSNQTTVVFNGTSLPPGIQAFAVSAAVSGQIAVKSYPFASIVTWNTAAANSANQTWGSASNNSSPTGTESLTISSETVTLNAGQAMIYSVHGSFDATLVADADSGNMPIMAHITF